MSKCLKYFSGKCHGLQKGRMLGNRYLVQFWSYRIHNWSSLYEIVSILRVMNVCECIDSVSCVNLSDCVILSDSFSYGDIHKGVFIPNNIVPKFCMIIMTLSNSSTNIKQFSKITFVNRDISVDLVWVLVQYLSFFQNLNQVLDS